MFSRCITVFRVNCWVFLISAYGCCGSLISKLRLNVQNTYLIAMNILTKDSWKLANVLKLISVQNEYLSNSLSNMSFELCKSLPTWPISTNLGLRDAAEEECVSLFHEMLWKCSSAPLNSSLCHCNKSGLSDFLLYSSAVG